MKENSTVISRSQQLKAATHNTHDSLDKRVMAADIFASRDSFARFLRVQYRFHRDIDALYAHQGLLALIPDLAERRRLPKIARDLQDLGSDIPAHSTPLVDTDISLPNALGWLYVAEGSNLGGTVLFKLARDRLQLHADFGARHLAAHADGAARHWRSFTAALDAAPLAAEQEALVVEGAREAFQSVRGYVEDELQTDPVPVP
ncbi:MAG: biliverdin-producing heme oxygenase [Stenotrophomonas sp.]